MDAASPHAATSTAGDAGLWGSYNRTPASDRRSPLRDLTPANVGRLEVLGAFDTGEVANFQCGPLALDGALVVTTDRDVYAIDPATCRLIWRSTRFYAPPSVLRTNRGAAHLDGRLFRGTNDARVQAISAGTGDALWEARIGDPAKGVTVPMAPVAWGGLVFAGTAGGDKYDVRGRVVALDAETGREVWRFDVVPEGDESPDPAQRRAAATWPPRAGARFPRSGGGMYGSFSLDAAAGLLYVPTGNPSPDLVREVRAGDNLYTNCLLELDARSGGLRRHWQLTPADCHDWNCAAAPALVTTRAGRRLALQGSKDGHVYGVDLDGGDVLYRTAVTTVENADAPLRTDRPTRFAPGLNGGVEWNGPAYDPDTNLFFVGAVDWASAVTVAAPDELRGVPGQDFMGWAGVRTHDDVFDPKERWGGWITAADADTGAVRWRHRTAAPQLGGVTATAGGLVFTGCLDGGAVALDAGDGGVLWRHDTGQPIGGGVVCFAGPDGRQRVAVAAGMDHALYGRTGTAKLVVFGVPG